MEGHYSGIACSVPQQAALVTVLSIAPSISTKKKLQTKKVGQELPSSLLQPPPFLFMQKTDPETTVTVYPSPPCSCCWKDVGAAGAAVVN